MATNCNPDERCLPSCWRLSDGQNRCQTSRGQTDWGLSLREVEDRSVRLAEEWGNPSYRISASSLGCVERDNRDLTAAKLIVLAVIFSIRLTNC
jgi:hypothetical protein